jgi:hypothetical protein
VQTGSSGWQKIGNWSAALGIQFPNQCPTVTDSNYRCDFMTSDVYAASRSSLRIADASIEKTAGFTLSF